MIKVVMQTKQATKTEERIVDLTTGRYRYYETGRAPLYDDNGKMIGTICSAIEITDKKEINSLILANQAHIIFQQEQQNKFRKIVEQVVHDIRSPLAAMKMTQLYF